MGHSAWDLLFTALTLCPVCNYNERILVITESGVRKATLSLIPLSGRVTQASLVYIAVKLLLLHLSKQNGYFDNIHTLTILTLGVFRQGNQVHVRHTAPYMGVCVLKRTATDTSSNK